jgi:hypothetical protein
MVPDQENVVVAPVPVQEKQLERVAAVNNKPEAIGFNTSTRL